MAFLMLAACAAQATDEEAVSGSEDALSGRNPVIEAARADGTAGEQASGYLGVAEGHTASDNLQRSIADINIKRRALYTEASVRMGVTVQAIAHETACNLFTTRVALNQSYQDEEGAWRVRTMAEPVVMPSFCR